LPFLKIQSYLFCKENKEMKIFSGQVFEVKADTSRSDFLGGLGKFGFFSGVEFECKDPNQNIFYVREVGVLERLGKMFRSVLSKDIYRASGDALLDLSQKNMVLAGILGRSVFDAREKLVSARELNDRLRLGENKIKSTEGSVLAVPSEGKLIITVASSIAFGSVKQVDLTQALTHENFRNTCKSALSKAIKKSSEDVLIVNFRPISDNDAPSDEAINKLFLVIDEHQQSNPTSRIMIATDRDRMLYEHLLNLKVQHDAKKISQSNTSNLSPMDLLMIPARGDEIVKLDPLDLDKLEKYGTKYNNVFVCITKYPEMIQSDLSIVNSNNLSPPPKDPDDKPAAASKLISSVDDLSDGSTLGAAFKKEKDDASKTSTLYAARFPAMDLPVKRLIVFEPVRGQWTPPIAKYDESVEKVKGFYLTELRKEGGRVVVQSPGKEYACEGLRRAIEELRILNQGPREVIITTGTYPDKALEGFLTNDSIQLH
jgi:hypothetical protein